MSDDATSASAVESVADTVSGAGLRALLVHPAVERNRKLISGAALLLALGGWMVGFVLNDLAWAMTSWCVALLVSILLVVAWIVGDPALPSLQSFRIGNSKPLGLPDGFAVSCMAITLFLTAMISVSKSNLVKPHTVRRQIVDIEFVSNADAENHNDILPGTKAAAGQKERHTNSSVTVPGLALTEHLAPKAKSTSMRQRAVKPSPPTAMAQAPSQLRFSVAPYAITSPPPQAKTATTNSERGPNKPDARARTDKGLEEGRNARENRSINAAASRQPVLFMKDESETRWMTKTFSSSSSHGLKRTSSPVMLEEAKPAEMVEVMDTQGDHGATKQWQPGGHSKGGEGAATPIADYLKEVHRVIKRAWTPPRGEPRTAEILFRIRPGGELCSIRLVRSSGSPDADEAAMNAISACSPFKPLPPQLKLSFLDLQYTFNYSVDRLSELPNQSVQ